MNFLGTPDGPGASVVSAETRVYATSPSARRRFGAYWRVIYPGSALIRRMWLRAVARRATRPADYRPPLPAGADLTDSLHARNVGAVLPIPLILASRSLAAFLFLFLAGGLVSAQQPAVKIVVVPTIGSDHQFNLDYSVAHLAALLDVIRPDAIIVDDATGWLARGCPLNAIPPETHVALSHSRDRAVPIFGLRSWPPLNLADPYAESQRAMDRDNAWARDTATSHSVWRAQLDRRTAEIARLYSYAGGATGIEQLLSDGFAERERALSPQQRTANSAQAAALADSVVRQATAAPAHGKWAIVVHWRIALPLTLALQSRSEVVVIPVDSFLPLPPERLSERMDRTHLSWILSSNLDEFYGMWAPQAFAGERLSDLLRRLERAAPGDPVTLFLRARWLMQERDYAAADTILTRLSALDQDAVFPFPINGKWIRPPWRSVRRKAQLNRAFILDYRGQREAALVIYRGLLALGPDLDADSRAFGYMYDDIQSVIRSYIERPYTGEPAEAFRHLLGTVRRPECEPGR